MESQSIETIQAFRINWVLINELALGPAPRTDSDLHSLNVAGIKAVLSLCSIGESQPPQGLTTHFQCERIVLPDHRSPDVLSLPQLTVTLLALAELCQQGPVFVHCVAAVERSPLICMAWLVQQQQLSPTEALDYLMQVHPGTNPLPEQYGLLKHINAAKIVVA